MCPAHNDHRDESFKGPNEVVEDSEHFYNEEDFEAPENNEPHGVSFTESNLRALSDEELIGVMKKILCNAVRQLICSVSGSNPSSRPCTFAGTMGARTNETGGCTGDSIVQRTVLGLNVSYYSKVIESLTSQRRHVIERYGFGPLLLFEKCAVPIPFAQWVVDHVQVNSSNIMIKDKSIPLSPSIVADVLGIPIGGRKISQENSKLSKQEFLSAIGSSNMLGVKAFGDMLLKDDLSDDEIEGHKQRICVAMNQICVSFSKWHQLHDRLFGSILFWVKMWRSQIDWWEGDYQFKDDN